MNMAIEFNDGKMKLVQIRQPELHNDTSNKSNLNHYESKGKSSKCMNLNLRSVKSSHWEPKLYLQTGKKLLKSPGIKINFSINPWILISGIPNLCNIGKLLTLALLWSKIILNYQNEYTTLICRRVTSKEPFCLLGLPTDLEKNVLYL